MTNLDEAVKRVKEDLGEGFAIVTNKVADQLVREIRDHLINDGSFYSIGAVIKKSLKL